MTNYSFIHLLKTLVRPHVEYCSYANWKPHYRKDKELLERIQRRYTKMINDMKGKMYEDMYGTVFKALDCGREKE